MIRWYTTSTEIEARKQAEESAKRENLALREEIDKTSMFEEIVGVSPSIRAVLSYVSKVAPTDSTVLITGETGTGEGACRSSDPQTIAAIFASLRQHQLRGDSTVAHRLGALWP